jgi:crotonobetainyl-CoA:carnitine CoA-transferase CaiB-like acyl-CoA transferase
LHERLNTYSGFLEHEHVVATRAIAWLDQQGASAPVPIPRLPGSPALSKSDPRAVSPVCGQHTLAVLQEHGLDATRIEALARSGAIGLDPAGAPERADSAG